MKKWLLFLLIGSMSNYVAATVLKVTNDPSSLKDIYVSLKSDAKGHLLSDVKNPDKFTFIKIGDTATIEGDNEIAVQTIYIDDKGEPRGWNDPFGKASSITITVFEENEVIRPAVVKNGKVITPAVVKKRLNSRVTPPVSPYSK